MRFSAISALLAAAMPALAHDTDYTLTCQRDLYTGDPVVELAYWTKLYNTLCIRDFQCKEENIPYAPQPYDTTIFGRCRGCIDNVPSTPMNGRCKLVKY